MSWDETEKFLYDTVCGIVRAEGAEELREELEKANRELERLKSTQRVVRFGQLLRRA